MERAKLGGIFTLICGALAFVYLGFMLLGLFFFSSIFGTESDFYTQDEIPREEFSDVMSIMTIYLIGIGVFYGLLGILGIVGGVYGLQRKYWGLALAGSIAGSISFFPCGIVAIIFTAMAKPEFDAISTIQTT